MLAWALKILVGLISLGGKCLNLLEKEVSAFELKVIIELNRLLYK